MRGSSVPPVEQLESDPIYSLEGYYSYTVTLRSAHFFGTFSAITCVHIAHNAFVDCALNSQFNHMSVSSLKDATRWCRELFSAVVHSSSYANKSLKGSRVWLEGLHANLL